MPIFTDNRAILVRTSTLKLHSHLLCNFSSEILTLLLDTLTGLETQELLHLDIGAVLFCNLGNVLAYGLLAIQMCIRDSL